MVQYVSVYPHCIKYNMYNEMRKCWFMHALYIPFLIICIYRIIVICKLYVYMTTIYCTNGTTFSIYISLSFFLSFFVSLPLTHIVSLLGKTSILYTSKFTIKIGIQMVKHRLKENAILYGNIFFSFISIANNEVWIFQKKIV